VCGHNLIHAADHADNKLVDSPQWEAAVIPVGEPIISTSKKVKEV